MKLTIETGREDDGRWIAEVPDLSGVLAYGVSREEAMAKAEALALRVLAEQLDHGEAKPIELSFAVAAE
jgi:predicted RNase H-like HicB family nuclease